MQLEILERQQEATHSQAPSAADPPRPPVTGLSFRRLLAAFIAGGSLLRLLAVFQHNPLELSTTDPGRWWYTATHLFDVQPIAAIDPFGYQLWLGAVAILTGSNSTGIALHNAALSIITPWIWHRLVKELTDDSNLALLAWAIFCWLPSWISIYSYTMSETLFLPLFGGALWLSARARRTGSNKCYWACALAWALAAATRVYALPFALALLLWTGWRSPRRIAKFSGAVVIFTLIAVPLSIRTHYLLNVWQPFGFPRMNQIYMESGKRTLRFDIYRERGPLQWTYEFGSPSLYQEPLAPLSHWRSTREGIAHFVIHESHGIADWDHALAAYRSSWPERLHLWEENYIFFNFAPSWTDNNPDRFWDWLAINTRWMWVPLAVIAMAGSVWLFAHHPQGPTRFFAVVASLAWTLTPLLPAIMEGRYRKPVEGLIIVSLLLLAHVVERRLRGDRFMVGDPPF